MALILLAASCAPVAQVQIERRGTALRGPISANYLLDLLLSRATLVEDFKAMADFSIIAPGRDFSAKQALLIKRPAMFRLETLSFFGQPQLYIVSDGRELNIFDPRGRKLYIAEATAQNNFKLFGIRRSLDDVVTILLGSVPLFIDPDQIDIRYFEGQGQYLLEATSRNGSTQKVWFDSASFNILGSELVDKDGLVELKARFENFTSHGDIDFPRTIELSLPADEARLKVKYDDLNLNEGLPDEFFKLRPPQDTEVYLLR